MARFDTVLSFSSHDPDAAVQPTNDHDAYDNVGSDDDAGFEFVFAPADDLFAHGRILPAYPVFDRGSVSLRSADDSDGLAAQQASTAPPSSDASYCAWAPGSPARREFPKSASTGEARRFWRLRDLVGGRSHSDGKEKFVFLQPSSSASSASNPSKTAEGNQKQDKKTSSAPLPQQQKQSKKKGSSKKATEMDMATAHKLFYGKPGAAGALPGGERKQHSYLPYRTGIVGFFATAHALGRSHHPY